MTKRSDYLWEHGIDLQQDAAIEAAIVHMRKTTGAIVDRHTMVKIIIMKWLDAINGTNTMKPQRGELLKPIQ